jgi:hypothetical protein
LTFAGTYAKVDFRELISFQLSLDPVSRSLGR